MPNTIRDDDQPGLWPLSETAEPTAKPSKSQHRTSAKPERQDAEHREGHRSPAEHETLWSIDDLAAHLTVPKSTIYGWRRTNYGPPSIKVGKHLRWRPASVSEWAATQEDLGR